MYVQANVAALWKGYLDVHYSFKRSIPVSKLEDEGETVLLIFLPVVLECAIDLFSPITDNSAPESMHVPSNRSELYSVLEFFDPRIS